MSLCLRSWNSQKVKSDITERLYLKGQLKAQKMQTYETKQNSLAGDELGVSKVHSDWGVETRYHTTSTRETSCAQEVKRNQMSILRLGVYFPADLYAYFLATNDPFKKVRIYLGLRFSKQRRQLNGKLEDRLTQWWQGKEKGKQNCSRQCDKCSARGDWLEKPKWCQMTYWTNVNVNKNQSQSSKYKYNWYVH